MKIDTLKESFDSDVAWLFFLSDVHTIVETSLLGQVEVESVYLSDGLCAFVKVEPARRECIQEAQDTLNAIDTESIFGQALLSFNVTQFLPRGDFFHVALNEWSHVEDGIEAEQDAAVKAMLQKYEDEPTSLWLYSDLPVEDRVSLAYLSADEWMGARFGTDIVRRVADAIQRVIGSSEDFFTQVAEKDPDRAERLQSLEWSIEKVPLNQIAPWNKMGGFPQEWTEGSIEDVATALEGSDEYPEEKNRLLQMAEKYATITKFLPPLLVPSELIRPDSDLPWACEDGNHRLVASALAGAEEVVCFVGRLEGQMEPIDEPTGADSASPEDSSSTPLDEPSEESRLSEEEFDDIDYGWQQPLSLESVEKYLNILFRRYRLEGRVDILCDDDFCDAYAIADDREGLESIRRVAFRLWKYRVGPVVLRSMKVAGKYAFSINLAGLEADGITLPEEESLARLARVVFPASEESRLSEEEFDDIDFGGLSLFRLLVNQATHHTAQVDSATVILSPSEGSEVGVWIAFSDGTELTFYPSYPEDKWEVEYLSGEREEEVGSFERMQAIIDQEVRRIQHNSVQRREALDEEEFDDIDFGNAPFGEYSIHQSTFLPSSGMGPLGPELTGEKKHFWSFHIKPDRSASDELAVSVLKGVLKRMGGTDENLAEFEERGVELYVPFTKEMKDKVRSILHGLGFERESYVSVDSSQSWILQTGDD